MMLILHPVLVTLKTLTMPEVSVSLSPVWQWLATTTGAEVNPVAL